MFRPCKGCIIISAYYTIKRGIIGRNDMSGMAAFPYLPLFILYNSNNHNLITPYFYRDFTYRGGCCCNRAQLLIWATVSYDGLTEALLGLDSLRSCNAFRA